MGGGLWEGGSAVLGVCWELRVVSVLLPPICSSSHRPNPTLPTFPCSSQVTCPTLRVNSEASLPAHLSWSVCLQPPSPHAHLSPFFSAVSWALTCLCASHSDCPLNRLIGPQTSVAISKLMVHFWCSALTWVPRLCPAHPYVSKCGSQGDSDFMCLGVAL